MSKRARKKNNSDGVKHDMKPKRKTLLPKNNLLSVLILLMMIVGAVFLVMLILVDILPLYMIGGLILVFLIFLVCVRLLFSGEKKVPHFIGVFLALIFFLVYGLGIGYLSSTYAMFNKIAVGSEGGRMVSSKDISSEPINVYITGIDQWSTEKGLDLERSDANMIVTIHPITHKILLTSIPRDTYVKLHTAQQMDKLTHTGIYGVDETLNTVEDWLGIDLDYYVKMNFTAVVKIIDAMGGIEVESPVEFNPVKMPDWTVKKGVNHMNGKQALAFARERKAFEEQDAARIENQQIVVEAMIKKLLSSSTLLTSYDEIMDAAGDNMTTDFSSKEIATLVRMQLTQPGEWSIKTQAISGEYGMDYVASLSSRNQYSIYRPSESSVNRVVKKIEEVQNPSEEELEEARKEMGIKSVVRYFNRITNREDSEKEE